MGTKAVNSQFSKEWMGAMRSMIKSPEKPGSETFRDLPNERKVIQTKYVFELERKGNRKLFRHKASLVAKVFSEIPAKDFLEVFSPVSRLAWYDSR